MDAITVGYSNISADDLGVYFGVDTGIFERNNLKVDAQLIAGGASTTAALLSGQIQISQAGGSETLSAVSNGADLVIVAVASGVYPYLFEVIPEIQTFQDLQGKKLGVSNIGGSADIATRVVLRQHGLDPEKDVTIVATGSAANRTSALSSGAIQGGMAAPPDTLTLESLGLHPLIDLATQHLPAANTVISVQRSYLNANRSIVQRYIDSIVQATAQMKRDQPTTIKVLKHYLASDDDKAMTATYDFFVKEVLETLPYPRPEHFKDATEALAPSNPKVKDVDLSKMLDASLVQDAANRGMDR